jgi:hypothetical protein
VNSCRTFRSLLCRFLIGTLLCTQWAVAAYACAGPAAMAAVQMGFAAPAAVAMPDCDMAMRPADAAAPHLCAEHCRQGQQADALPALTLPAAVMVSLYPLPAPVEAPVRDAGVATTVATLGPAPPPLELTPGRLRI